jgi:hypothetical protein
MFELMFNLPNDIRKTSRVSLVILDMSDCYTWSFPEFIPFCSSLFYFSTFKAFNPFSRA